MDQSNHLHFHTQQPTQIDAYIANLLLSQPHVALKAGLHSGDGRVADWSASGIAHRQNHLHQTIALLEPIANSPLLRHPQHDHLPNRLISANYHTWDARLCLTDAKTELYTLNTLRFHETNPLAYLPILDITPYLKRTYLPIDDRITALIEHLERIPEVFSHAQYHLRHPISRELLQQSISTYLSLLRFHRVDLIRYYSKSRHTDIVIHTSKANNSVIDAYQRFITFLENLLPDAPIAGTTRTVSIADWFRVSELIHLNTEQLIALGKSDLANNAAHLRELAQKAGRSIGELIQEHGASPHSIQDILPNTRKIVDQLKSFIVQQDLVTIIPSGPCYIMETQSHMRSGSAFLDAPGPFEQGQIATYFFLTLPDPAWTPEQQQQWLVKQGQTGLTNTAIHEVWPGHYLQFTHLAHAPTRAGKILTSTAFIEGWAHFAEEFMIEAGYKSDKPEFQAQQLMMAILRDCRLIVSVQIHQGSMTIDEATHFIMQETGFPAIRANQEALRCLRDLSYGAYVLGKLHIKQLRDDLLKVHPAMSQCTVNDTLLAFGAPPIPLLYEALLGRQPSPLI